MGILFDSKDALLGGPVVVTLRFFDVLRDWVGHITESNDIDRAEDFDFFGPDFSATAFNAGPYDINNAIDVTDGADHLDNTMPIVANATENKVELAGWVKLDDVPVPVGSAFELSFFKVTNIGNGDFLEQFFLLNTDGTIQLRCKFKKSGTTYTATHPDNMDRTNWTFFACQWDHTSVGGADTIYMDPGNDNLLGFDPGPTIASNTYDIIELFKDSGQGGPGTKEVKFSNLLLIRVPPPDSGTQDVIFTTPGMSSFTVPAGITSLTSTMWSGGGGGGGGGSDSVAGDGGGSGFTQGTHVVTPGAELEVWVGAGGGFGLGASTSGQGGGSAATSSLWTFGQATLLQAVGGGAGGGGGDNSSFTAGGQGGPGGGTTGVDGTASAAALPGKGGTQSAGGLGGVGNNTGEDGSSFQGGRGANGQTGLGGANNAAPVNGAAGGHYSTAQAGFAGGGGGAAGYFGGGGGGSSVSGNAGGAGGGGGSGFMHASATSTTNSQGSAKTPAGTGDPLYVVPVGEGGDGGGLQGNGQNGADGRHILSYGIGPASSWRETVRGFTTQNDFDDFVIDTVKPVRFWRTSEYDLGSGRGDRFIHDISGFLNPGFAPNGTLTRNVASGPLDTSNSYEYEAGCVSQVQIFYADIDTWALTCFFFFKQPTSPSSDNNWFVRFENDANEYIQLERNGNDVTFRAQFSDLSQHVFTDVGSSMLDGSWHRIVMAANTTNSGWIFGIDGVNVMGQPSAVLTLSAPFKRILWGTIDVNLAVMGWANYLDPDILTTFTTVTTELGVRQYIEARTDTPPSGTEYYGGYYSMQDQEIGSVPP